MTGELRPSGEPEAIGELVGNARGVGRGEGRSNSSGGRRSVEGAGRALPSAAGSTVEEDVGEGGIRVGVAQEAVMEVRDPNVLVNPVSELVHEAGEQERVVVLLEGVLDGGCPTIEDFSFTFPTLDGVLGQFREEVDGGEVEVFPGLGLPQTTEGGRGLGEELVIGRGDDADEGVLVASALEGRERTAALIEGGVDAHRPDGGSNDGGGPQEKVVEEEAPEVSDEEAALIVIGLQPNSKGALSRKRGPSGCAKGGRHFSDKAVPREGGGGVGRVVARRGCVPTGLRSGEDGGEMTLAFEVVGAGR